jgi:hypothetical protein
MPTMPTAIAPLLTYMMLLACPPATTPIMPMAIAPIGRYVSACDIASWLCSGISGGDCRAISPRGMAGAGSRSPGLRTFGGRRAGTRNLPFVFCGAVGGASETAFSCAGVFALKDGFGLGGSCGSKAGAGAGASGMAWGRSKAGRAGGCRSNAGRAGSGTC